MSRKITKPKPSNILPGQLTLFDLSEFSNQAVSVPYSAKLPESKKSISTKEAKSAYTTNPNNSVEIVLNTSNIKRVVVPIEIAFDVCQGIRDVKQFWVLNNKPELEVIFDARHLDLANYYVAGNKEVFNPEEQYLVGKGGLINISTFFNLLRCKETLNDWSNDEWKKTGKRPINKFDFIPPNTNAVKQLWNNLGMPDPYINSSSNVAKFRSRYITPILWVDELSEQEVFDQFSVWTHRICQKLSSNLKTDLLMQAIPEITSNLVKHGFGGLFCVAVWRSGQIEIFWSNLINHIKDWPPEDTAYGLAEGLQKRGGGGAGMKHIREKLLPRYDGVLEVNYKDIDLCFYSEGGYEILGQGSRRDESDPNNGNDLLPNSILFTMHLFCKQTRDDEV